MASFEKDYTRMHVQQNVKSFSYEFLVIRRLFFLVCVCVCVCFQRCQYVCIFSTFKEAHFLDVEAVSFEYAHSAP